MKTHKDRNDEYTAYDQPGPSINNNEDIYEPTLYEQMKNRSEGAGDYENDYEPYGNREDSTYNNYELEEVNT